MTAPALLNYQRSGQLDAPTTILIHGLFGDLDNLKRLGRELEDSYDVVYLDVRNHGDSFHSEQMSYPELAADVFRLMDHLEINKAHLIGHSMGGKITMECALQKPERVLSVVAADIAPVGYQARHNHILEALEQLPIDTMSQRKEADQALAKSIAEPGVRQFLLKNLTRVDDHFAWRLNLEGIKHNYPQINGEISSGHYNGPILFIKGGNSDYLTAEHESAIRDRFSDTDVKVIADTGHWLHAEKPHIFNRLVLSFLAQQQSQ